MLQLGYINLAIFCQIGHGSCIAAATMGVANVSYPWKTILPWNLCLWRLLWPHKGHCQGCHKFFLPVKTICLQKNYPPGKKSIPPWNLCSQHQPPPLMSHIIPPMWKTCLSLKIYCHYFCVLLTCDLFAIATFLVCHAYAWFVSDSK